MKTIPPFTLALSSGFFGFYAHVGFLKALARVGLAPSGYAGTSAGGVIAAAAARGFSAQQVETLILRLERKDFWDPSLGPGFLRGQKMQDLFTREIGDDFKELAYPLRIPVYDLGARKTRVFTSGALAGALRATCAVPIMFHPVRLGTRLYVDGGIQDKMGLTDLPANEKIICHYLKSWGNDPHTRYERHRDNDEIKRRGAHLIIIELENLPRAHPFTMNKGPQIVQAAYEQSLAHLEQRLRQGLWT